MGQLSHLKVITISIAELVLTILSSGAQKWGQQRDQMRVKTGESARKVATLEGRDHFTANIFRFNTGIIVGTSLKQNGQKVMRVLMGKGTLESCLEDHLSAS